MTEADTNILLILAGIVLLVVAVIWFTIRNRRTRALKDQYGPEYGRTVKEAGGVSRAEADDLLTKVMGARGYPTVDFKRQSADLSVHHGTVVEHYHAAHEIALRNSENKASTEDLRQGMVHYRALFDDLVNEADGAKTVPGPAPSAA